eukprot:4117629-Alexandrium_andersonii.AAC.4
MTVRRTRCATAAAGPQVEAHAVAEELVGHLVAVGHGVQAGHVRGPLVGGAAPPVHRQLAECVVALQEQEAPVARLDAEGVWVVGAAAEGPVVVHRLLVHPLVLDAQGRLREQRGAEQLLRRAGVELGQHVLQVGHGLEVPPVDPRHNAWTGAVHPEHRALPRPGGAVEHRHRSWLAPVLQGPREPLHEVREGLGAAAGEASEVQHEEREVRLGRSPVDVRPAVLEALLRLRAFPGEALVETQAAEGVQVLRVQGGLRRRAVELQAVRRAALQALLQVPGEESDAPPPIWQLDSQTAVDLDRALHRSPGDAGDAVRAWLVLQLHHRGGARLGHRHEVPPEPRDVGGQRGRDGLGVGQVLVGLEVGCSERGAGTCWRCGARRVWHFHVLQLQANGDARGGAGGCFQRLAGGLRAASGLDEEAVVERRARAETDFCQGAQLRTESLSLGLLHQEGHPAAARVARHHALPAVPDGPLRGEVLRDEGDGPLAPLGVGQLLGEAVHRRGEGHDEVVVCLGRAVGFSPRRWRPAVGHGVQELLDAPLGFLALVVEVVVRQPWAQRGVGDDALEEPLGLWLFGQRQELAVERVCVVQLDVAAAQRDCAGPPPQLRGAAVWDLRVEPRGLDEALNDEGLPDRAAN